MKQENQKRESVSQRLLFLALIGLFSSLALLRLVPDRITVESMEEGARSLNAYHVELRPAAKFPLGESSQIAVRLTRISDEYSGYEVEVELSAPASTIEIEPDALSISRSRDFGRFTVIALRPGRQTLQVSTRLRPIDPESRTASDESIYDRDRTLTRPVEPRTWFRRENVQLLAALFATLFLGSLLASWFGRIR